MCFVMRMFIHWLLLCVFSSRLFIGSSVGRRAKGNSRDRYRKTCISTFTVACLCTCLTVRSPLFPLHSPQSSISSLFSIRSSFSSLSSLSFLSHLSYLSFLFPLSLSYQTIASL